jgi:hypothetical protein
MTYDKVNRISLDNVRPLQVIPPGDGAGDLSLGRRVDQAEIGLDVGVLFLLGQGSPT